MFKVYFENWRGCDEEPIETFETFEAAAEWVAKESDYLCAPDEAYRIYCVEENQWY